MLSNLLKRTRLAARLRGAWRREADEALKPVRKDVRRLAAEVDELRGTLRHTALRAARGDRASAQIRAVMELNEAQRDRLVDLPALLDQQRLMAHVSRAINTAELHTEPFEHIVVDQILPPDVYDLLLSAIPPTVFFDDHDPIKPNLVFPFTFGPTFCTDVWNAVDTMIARRCIQPAVLDKFHQPLQDHYDAVFGAEFRTRADALPKLSAGGRLMLRRPGYHLGAHRDPKRSMLTCLLYLARPGDDEQHGTQLFRVTNDREASYKQTYYPGADGGACDLATVVPFRPNTMLVFLNAHGAHGATIPVDAGEDLERYSYQFYVAPENAALGALIRQLPRDRRTMWQNKNKVAAQKAPI
jgi:hypothetical protein